jgi:hypothetical protein
MYEVMLPLKKGVSISLGKFETREEAEELEKKVPFLCYIRIT